MNQEEQYGTTLPQSDLCFIYHRWKTTYPVQRVPALLCIENNFWHGVSLHTQMWEHFVDIAQTLLEGFVLAKVQLVIAFDSDNEPAL